MCEFIKIIFLTLSVPYMAYADRTFTPISVAIGLSQKSEIQISTTKDSLRGDDVLICLAEKKSCTPYQGSEFLKIQPNDSVEDIATGEKIYTFFLKNSKNESFQAEISLAFILHGGGVKTSNVKFNGNNSYIILNNEIKSVFTYCKSSEGVHFYSNSGDIHLYYSLGYAVDSNCSDEVYK